MKTYKVQVGGISRRYGRFSNIYFETVRAENAKDAKLKVIRKLKSQGINLPGRTIEQNMRWSTTTRAKRL